MGCGEKGRSHYTHPCISCKNWTIMEKHYLTPRWETMLEIKEPCITCRAGKCQYAEGQSDAAA